MKTEQECVQWNSLPLREKLLKLKDDMQGLPAWSPIDRGIKYVPCACGIQLMWLDAFDKSCEAQSAGVNWCNKNLDDL